MRLNELFVDLRHTKEVVQTHINYLIGDLKDAARSAKRDTIYEIHKYYKEKYVYTEKHDVLIDLEYTKTIVKLGIINFICDIKRLVRRAIADIKVKISKYYEEKKNYTYTSSYRVLNRFKEPKGNFKDTDISFDNQVQSGNNKVINRFRRS